MNHYRQFVFCLVATVVLVGCGPKKAGHDDHDDHKRAGHKAHGQGRIIRISLAALRQGTVKLDRVRAVSFVGGIDITAEIQANPNSTAHVMPLTIGRLR